MPLAQAEEFAGLEDPDKVIVRSDGTVTYVGKDIAYQLWKFGLLGRDFGYRFWSEEGVWETTHGRRRGASAVRQRLAGDSTSSTSARATCRRSSAPGSRPSATPTEAERSIHFAYEMVALSPATARQLGFLDEDEGGGQGPRDVRPQGDRRQGRRPDRPARGQGARGDRQAQPRSRGGRARRARPRDRHRRPALLHGQGDQQPDHRLRLRRGAELRGGVGPLPPVLAGAGEEHPPPAAAGGDRRRTSPPRRSPPSRTSCGARTSGASSSRWRRPARRSRRPPRASSCR